MDISENIVNEIKQLADKYAVEKIVLFGSRARKSNRFNSDIDLAVFPDANFNQKGALSADLDEINTLLKIDVVFVTSDLDPKLLASINNEGVVIYENKTQ